MTDALARAAELIHDADALLVCAGAGMGVDSGLPDFRGTDGFWRAYPPLAKLGISFAGIASPRWFADNPRLAWGFYGHRQGLYRATVPHEGFAILRRWMNAKPNGGFVFTSNVDGQFQKAGFDTEKIVECHGSIHHLQCRLCCSDEIWEFGDIPIKVDEETLLADEPLPVCPKCGHIARPNIAMFSDWAWESGRTDAQETRMRRTLQDWRHDGAKIVIVECGAGTAIPSVRSFGESVTCPGVATLIRINVRESDVPGGAHIGLAMGAKEALMAIDTILTGA